MGKSVTKIMAQMETWAIILRDQCDMKSKSFVANHYNLYIVMALSSVYWDIKS